MRAGRGARRLPARYGRVSRSVAVPFHPPPRLNSQWDRHPPRAASLSFGRERRCRRKSWSIRTTPSGSGTSAGCSRSRRASSATFPDVSVLIVTGSPMLQAFRVAPGLDYVKLPCLRRTQTGGYATKSLGMGLRRHDPPAPEHDHERRARLRARPHPRQQEALRRGERAGAGAARGEPAPAAAAARAPPARHPRRPRGDDPRLGEARLPRGDRAPLRQRARRRLARPLRPARRIPLPARERREGALLRLHRPRARTPHARAGPPGARRRRRAPRARDAGRRRGRPADHHELSEGPARASARPEPHDAADQRARASAGRARRRASAAAARCRASFTANSRTT